MFAKNDGEVQFIIELKKLALELNRFKSDHDIDNIKELFIRNMSLLKETNALNNLISQLVILSEKEVNGEEVEAFIGLISAYWLELLLPASCHFVFFGNTENFNKLSRVMNEGFPEVKHIYIDKSVNLDDITLSTPEGTRIIAIYDDAGSDILKAKRRFLFIELLYLDDFLFDSTKATVKQKIAYFLNRNKLLMKKKDVGCEAPEKKHDIEYETPEKKHDVLLPIHELIIDRNKIYNLGF